MLKRYHVLKIKNGLLRVLRIVFINCLSMVALASTADSYTQWITPDNVKTFQAIIKIKPALYWHLIQPLTIDKTAINLTDQNITNLPQYINYTFEDNVNYFFSTMQNNAMFRVTNFKKNVDFSGVVFLREADFTWSNFEGITTFMSAKFHKNTYFFMSKFLKKSNLSMTVFFKSINFRASQFMSDTDFKGSVFHDAVDFERVVFNKSAIFSDTQFDMGADFKNTDFIGFADFTNSYFGKIADFSHSKFLGDSSFNYIILPAFLDFSNVTIKENIDLSTALPNPKGLTKLNLIHTDVSKVKLQYYQRFKLYFPQDASDGDISFVYLSLLESFKKDGLDKSYHKLSVEYAEYKYLKNNQPILNAIDKYWWDYGFDKSRIFLWIIIIILFFTLINNLFYEQLLKNAYDIPYLHSYPNEFIKKNFFARFIYNFPYALLYTITLFWGKLIGFNIDSRRFESKNYFLNLYLYLIIIIGLACVFFAFNSIFKATPVP